VDNLRPNDDAATGQIVSFDEALLDTCAPELKAELLGEAQLLIQAFAPDCRCDEVEAMAQALSRGGRDAEMDRERARRLAAALRHISNRTDA
jgi:hypothetical protein